jgi:hypothetical protein
MEDNKKESRVYPLGHNPMIKPMATKCQTSLQYKNTKTIQAIIRENAATTNTNPNK